MLNLQLGTALALVMTDRGDAILVVVADMEVVHVNASAAAHTQRVDNAIFAIRDVALSEHLFNQWAGSAR